MLRTTYYALRTTYYHLLLLLLLILQLQQQQPLLQLNLATLRFPGIPVLLAKKDTSDSAFKWLWLQKEGQA